MDVLLPDGTLVRATSVFDSEPGETPPTFGLYLDTEWKPAWANDRIDWPDRGLPTNWEKAAAQIKRAFTRAKSGEIVEVGCRLGLGRTGTVLACMATLAGLPADEAVPWVRKSYRAASVETPDQEAWVRWFASWVQEGLPRRQPAKASD